MPNSQSGRAIAVNRPFNGVMSITELPNLLQALLLTVLVILATAAAVTGTLMLMSRLESAMPKARPDN
jgi:hypothetical protein